MIRLRQYKASDAKTIVGWCKTEEDFRKWTSDRYDKFPITSEDMNKKYLENNPAAFYCYKAAGFVEQPEKNFEVEIFGEKWKILEMEVIGKI